MSNSLSYKKYFLDYYKKDAKTQKQDNEKGGEKASSKKKGKRSESGKKKKKPSTKGKKLAESGNYFDEDQFNSSDGKNTNE